MSGYIIQNATLFDGEKIEDGMSIAFSDGTIEMVCKAEELAGKEGYTKVDAAGLLISPGFIDTHTHGSYGHSTEDADPESILQWSRKITATGVTSFCPTTYTSPLDRLVEATECITAAMGNEKGARILGINHEGPFISPEKVGGQDRNGLQKVDTEIFRRLTEHGNVRMMTIAPELEGVERLSPIARERGVTMMAGHTNASLEDMKKAKRLGFRGMTHIFNAMSSFHHRTVGAAGFALADDDIFTELIADGHHVDPEIVRVLFKCKGRERVVMVTDSLKPAHLEAGVHTINGIESVFRNGTFVSKSDNSLLVGSALSMDQGVRNLVEWGIPLDVALRTATSNPASLHGFEKIGYLRPLYRADIVVLDRKLNVKAIFVDGVLKEGFIGKEVQYVV